MAPAGLGGCYYSKPTAPPQICKFYKWLKGWKLLFLSFKHEGSPKATPSPRKEPLSQETRVLLCKVVLNAHIKGVISTQCNLLDKPQASLLKAFFSGKGSFGLSRDVFSDLRQLRPDPTDLLTRENSLRGGPMGVVP